jgi:hypothetical protein
MADKGTDEKEQTKPQSAKTEFDDRSPSQRVPAVDAGYYNR